MKNIKKYASAALMIGLIFGNVFVASAQTTATSTSATALQALIQTLQKQIESLTTQLQTLQRAQTQLQTATTTESVADALKLIGQLKEGSRGEKVRVLQAILSADEDVYPEGNVSGYYGKLTAQAVKRFQKKYELEQVGNVGKKTLEKLTKEIEKNPIAIEMRDGERRPCAIVPPGHLIAPGWLRKMGGAPIIPACQTIPEGIEKKIKRSTTTDAMAPRIEEIEVDDVSANSVRIDWETNEPATGAVWYGTATSTAMGSGSTVNSSALVKEHKLVLSSLAAGTTYYYVIVSVDMAGNTTTSTQRSFTTSLSLDATAPTISNVYATSTTASGVHVVWVTSEPATSVVWYGTSTPITNVTATSQSAAAMVSGHDVALTNLIANTTYFYRVVSTDGAGNTATSTEYSFATSAMPDITAPVISGAMATSTTGTASHIVWNTNESATGKLWYSTSTPVVITGIPAMSSATLSAMHDFLLSGLATSTTYYYAVSSVDAAGNAATSTELSFQTRAQ